MDEDRQQLLARQEILSAYVTALDRVEDLLRVCARVRGDGDDASSAVAEAFGVSRVAADAILTLQVRRFTPTAIERIRVELADVGRQLTEAEGA